MSEGASVSLLEELPADPPAPTRPKKRIWLIVLTIFVAVFFTLPLVGALVLRVFVVQTFFIPSGSMAPTLMIGNRILVDRLSYDGSQVHVGDIIVFTTPPKENCGDGPTVGDLVKRVVGLPGQTISLYHGRVEVDGKLLDETWLPSTEQGLTVPGPAGTPYSLAKPYKVPLNDYFVMGDNRVFSCDSRYWGPITKSSIVGKVVVRVWPFSAIHVF